MTIAIMEHPLADLFVGAKEELYWGFPQPPLKYPASWEEDGDEEGRARDKVVGRPKASRARMLKRLEVALNAVGDDGRAPEARHRGWNWHDLMKLTPEQRSEASRRLWQDPAYRERCRQGRLRSEAKRSLSIQALWADPERRAAFMAKKAATIAQRRGA